MWTPGRMGEKKAAEEPYDAELKAIGRRVRDLRLDRGWGAGGLADRAGLHWTYVRDLEQGRRRISVVTLLKLAKGLGVDPCVLLHDAAERSTQHGGARR